MDCSSTMPNAENCTLEELQIAARAAATYRSANRIMVVRALLLGYSFEQVSPLYAVSLRTVYRCVKRFNERGIDGLLDAARSGRPRKIAAGKTEQLRSLIQEPQRAGQTHWTGRKFHGYLRDVLQQEVGYRTVVRWLHEQGFRLKVPQPWPDRQDEEKRRDFVQQVRGWLQDNDVDLWYGDEMGVEGDPRPRRRWAKRGEKTRVTKNGDHVRMNVAGAICPRTGEAFALEFTHSDRDCFQAFLEQANEHVCLQRPRNLLIVDNASWHKSKTLDWGRFEPVYLPPYSPDLNPIERLWLLIKTEWFADFVAKDRDHLIQRLDKALCWAMTRKNHNQKTCAIKTKL